MQNTYNKYGEESFSFAVVEDVADALFVLAREQFHMWRHPGNLMNAIPVSDSIYAAHEANRGRIMPAEERAKRSVKAKEIFCLDAHKAKYTPEVRGRMSISRKARVMPPCSDVTKDKIAKSNSGPKTKQHIENSLSAKFKWIETERITWLSMIASGMSYRAIEQATGRSRKMIARECKVAT